MRLYQKPDVNVLTKLLSNPLLINGLSNSLPFAMVVPNVITKGTSLCQPTKKKKKKRTTLYQMHLKPGWVCCESGSGKGLIVCVCILDQDQHLKTDPGLYGI